MTLQTVLLPRSLPNPSVRVVAIDASKSGIASDLVRSGDLLQPDHVAVAAVAKLRPAPRQAGR
jgi:hypothetical protein